VVHSTLVWYMATLCGTWQPRVVCSTQNISEILTPSLAYMSVWGLWVGIVWAFILTFVWLRGQIHAGEWCYEVVKL